MGQLVAVPRLWPGETAVICASGPSLTAEDVEYCRGKARTIVINSTYQIAPWADVLYAADRRWWQWHKGAMDFKGLKYSLERPDPAFGVVTLTATGDRGLAHEPHTLRTGRNSGYQAINLAKHLGVSRIVLLGYDMQTTDTGKQHWHEDHPGNPRMNFAQWLPYFQSLVGPLQAAGVAVVNCTRATALHCFPRAALEVTL
jgi:hypothetical protein